MGWTCRLCGENKKCSQNFDVVGSVLVYDNYGNVAIPSILYIMYFVMIWDENVKQM
jgi:hypothetical protein